MNPNLLVIVCFLGMYVVVGAIIWTLAYFDDKHEAEKKEWLAKHGKDKGRNS